MYTFFLNTQKYPPNFCKLQKKKREADASRFVGKDGFEPPKSKDSRFTVCPIWPLWNLPRHLSAHLRVQRYNYFSKMQAQSTKKVGRPADISSFIPYLLES